MKVPMVQGLANRILPESCMVHREVWREALTGALAGQPLSRERDIKFPGADTLLYVEGKTVRCIFTSTVWTWRGLRPWHGVRLLCGNREISCPTTGGNTAMWSVSGRRGAEADDERTGKVGLSHSPRSTG